MSSLCSVSHLPVCSAALAGSPCCWSLCVCVCVLGVRERERERMYRYAENSHAVFVLCLCKKRLFRRECRPMRRNPSAPPSAPSIPPAEIRVPVFLKKIESQGAEPVSLYSFSIAASFCLTSSLSFSTGSLLLLFYSVT